MEIPTKMDSQTQRAVVCPLPKWQGEVKAVLEKYRTKLYVFVSPQNQSDRRTREIIGITMVRMAQGGNESAKQKLTKLLAFTIDDWIERHWFLSRWRGYAADIRVQVERCIRRYRYSGSFLRYLFRTLEYAGRGIRPLAAYSLDEPIFDESARKIDRVSKNSRPV
jgi:uncharacterized protein YlxP (DUF503 family)